MSGVTETGCLENKTGNKLGKGLIALLLVLYVLDQVTKMLVVWKFYAPFRLAPLVSYEPRIFKLTVIEGFFNIVRVHNTGVAFGLGNGTSWSTYLFFAIPLIAMTVLIVLLRKGFVATRGLKIAWVLVMVGICGNLTDRLIQGFILTAHYRMELSFWEKLKNGAVIDFVDIIVPFTNGWHWPAFNVADSCICIAAGILIFQSFRDELNKKKLTPS